MKRIVSAARLTLPIGTLALVALLSSTVHSQSIVINELWADDGDADTNEFVELFGPGNASLDGLSVIVIDNDNAGNTASSTYRRVNVQYDLTGNTIPADGYFLIGGGPGVTGIADFPLTVGDLQNGSQTYALVRNADLAFCVDAAAGCDSDGAGHVDDDELTPGSIAALAAGALDVIATWNEDVGDLFDFTPIISQDFGVDAASRLPNGVDTNAASDWGVFNTFDLTIELGDANDTFGTPGAENMVVPEPSPLVLLMGALLAVMVVGRRR